MQWPRRCLVLVGVLAVLGAPAASAASAETFLGVRNIDCSGVTVSGAGLPHSAPVVVTLTDSRRQPLQRQPLETSPSGSFTWRTRISLSGLRAVRAVVTRADAGTPIAWAEHSVPRPCPLVTTGADRSMPIAGLALSSIVLGFLLLTAVTYRISIGLFYRGRHVATR
jgi:hypothetical protein